MSRQERAQIEEALKAGRLPAVVATSSLELGIDMGAVDLVIQVESAPSVASGLQRTGRAGHRVGDVSRSVIFPKYPGDLVEATVVVQRMRNGEIEELRVPRNPLDVLAQQIVAMVAMDDWQVGDVEQLVRRAAPFSGLTRGVLDAVLDMLAGRYPSEEFAELRPRLIWDRTTGTLRGRPGAQRLAVTSGGTIPDRGLFGVFLAGPQRQGRNSHRVGELDEEMVYESRVGDVFVLGASSWRIEDITADQVLVSPAPGQPGRLPFWHGDTMGRPAELGRAVGAFCREIAAAGRDEAATRLRIAGLDDLAAQNLIRYLDGQREATGYLPDDRTLVMERFRDELGDWRLVLHSPYGARVHAPWALAIAARLRERYEGMDVQALHTDDGIVLRVPDTDEPPPAGIAELAAEEVEPIVTAELGGSALFASRFRECAARALLLPRRRPGHRSPLWQQRQRSAQLLAVASKYGTFPVVLETVRECLQDTFDVPALAGLMRDLASRKVRLVEVETSVPSPFAKSLLFSYIGAFMYEGDSPLAERKAQALALDSSLLAELLGQADLRELLDPAVVGQVEAELQRRTTERACRSLEAVADLLRVIGPLSEAEVAQRCAEPGMAAGWLAELDASRRAIEVRVGGEARWAAIEDAGRLRDALGVPLPPGVPVAFTEPVADPLGDLVARYARCHGPFTAQAAAGRYGLGVAVITGTLHRLAAEHRVVEGEFVPGGRGTEWCDAEVLRMLRRRCLAKLRKEVEPAPPEALAAFLPAWQNAGQPVEGPRRGTAGRAARGWRPASADAVFDAVDQLAGAALPASALETLVLPGRVPGYQPAVLDELTAAGEVVWSGAGGLPGGDGWVVLAPAQAVPLLLPPPAEITMTPVHDAVLAVLEGGGGLFFRMLADRVAGMLKDHDWRGLSDMAVAAAIWDLAWAGRLTNDTLAPLRTVLGTGRPVFDGVPPGRQAIPAAPGPLAGAGSGVNGGAQGVGHGAAGQGSARAGRCRCGPGEHADGGPFGPDGCPQARVRAAGGAHADRAADGDRQVVAAARPRSRHNPALARHRPGTARPARHRDPWLGGGRARAGRVRRAVPGAAGHGGGRAVPARVLRRGARRGAVRPARRGGPDAGRRLGPGGGRGRPAGRCRAPALARPAATAGPPRAGDASRRADAVRRADGARPAGAARPGDGGRPTGAARPAGAAWPEGVSWPEGAIWADEGTGGPAAGGAAAGDTAAGGAGSGRHGGRGRRGPGARAPRPRDAGPSAGAGPVGPRGAGPSGAPDLRGRRASADLRGAPGLIGREAPGLRGAPELRGPDRRSRCSRRRTRRTRSVRPCPGRNARARFPGRTGPAARRARWWCCPMGSSCSTWSAAARPCSPGPATRRCSSRRPRGSPRRSGVAHWAASPWSVPTAPVSTTRRWPRPSPTRASGRPPAACACAAEPAAAADPDRGPRPANSPAGP